MPPPQQSSWGDGETYPSLQQAVGVVREYIPLQHKPVGDKLTKYMETMTKFLDEPSAAQLQVFLFASEGNTSAPPPQID